MTPNFDVLKEEPDHPSHTLLEGATVLMQQMPMFHALAHLVYARKDGEKTVDRIAKEITKELIAKYENNQPLPIIILSLTMILAATSISYSASKQATADALSLVSQLLKDMAEVEKKQRDASKN